jgi:SAM-dependent methyltransferase
MPSERGPSADASMRAYYARRASIYDEVYLRPERQADLRWLQAAVPAWLAGRRVLELACGTGYWTQFIAPATASMVAADALAEPLAFARLRPGVHGVEFMQADAYALPAALGRFDAAFAGLWLSHVPVGRRREFLDGLHARLVPGARVVLIDNTDAQCARLPIAERDAEGTTCQMRVLPDGSTHLVLKNSPARGELLALVEGAGENPQYWRGGHFWALCCDLVRR